MVSIRKPGILPFCDALHSFRKAPKRDCKKKGEIRSGVQEFGLTNALSFYNRSEIKRSTPLPPTMSTVSPPMSVFFPSLYPQKEISNAFRRRSSVLDRKSRP